MITMKQVLEIIARSLVDHPEAVSVTEVEAEDSVTLELRVAEDDMGKAIRTVVKAAANRENKRVVVEII